MTEPSPHARSGDRFEAFIVVFLAAVILVVAWFLSPDPDGYGTHRKLLLLPCIFRTITGLPCPFCGMTTAFTFMARLQVAQAFGAHALGPLAYLLTWVAGLRGVYALARGLPLVPAWMGGLRGTKVFLILVGAGWIINIIRVLVA